jgi:hypothetical protein
VVIIFVSGFEVKRTFLELSKNRVLFFNLVKLVLGLQERVLLESDGFSDYLIAQVHSEIQVSEDELIVMPLHIGV